MDSQSLEFKRSLNPIAMMGESFQDYSCVQDFEADLKMLNSAGNSVSDLLSVYRKVFDL